MKKVIYCFWFGSAMSENRKSCYQSLVDNSGVNVTLITDDNINEFLVEPLHEGFQYLSATHKADYMRCYMMRFHGGGYSDIKQCDFDWNPYFDKLEQSDREFIGYGEKNIHGVSNACSIEVKNSWNKLVGMGHFIFKPDSQFASLWYDALCSKLTSTMDTLTEHPGTYHPRAVRGGHQKGGPLDFARFKYPFNWSELLGDIVHELQYQHQQSFFNGMPFVNMKDYR